MVQLLALSALGEFSLSMKTMVELLHKCMFFGLRMGGEIGWFLRCPELEYALWSNYGLSGVFCQTDTRFRPDLLDWYRALSARDNKVLIFNSCSLSNQAMPRLIVMDTSVLPLTAIGFSATISRNLSDVFQAALQSVSGIKITNSSPP